MRVHPLHGVHSTTGHQGCCLLLLVKFGRPVHVYINFKVRNRLYNHCLVPCLHAVAAGSATAVGSAVAAVGAAPFSCHAVHVSFILKQQRMVIDLLRQQQQQLFFRLLGSRQALHKTVVLVTVLHVGSFQQAWDILHAILLAWLYGVDPEYNMIGRLPAGCLEDGGTLLYGAIINMH